MRERAVVVDEVGERGAPVAGVDGAIAVLDVARDAAVVPRPEPDVDFGGGALHSIPMRFSEYKLLSSL